MKDYHKQIEQQEKKSSELWRKTDRETSSETRKENMWKRVVNRVKIDGEVK